MRYFLELSYRGTHYYGWQRQAHHVSVQQRIEEVMATLLQQPVPLTGCGRTDTGVHARQYFAHFDWNGEFPANFPNRLNRMLPHDIAVRRVLSVQVEAHARFDATLRSYEYHLSFRKIPFQTDMAYWFAYAKKPDFAKMQTAAALLLEFDDFQTFCKADHDAETTICQLSRSEWIVDEPGERLLYHISSNRFLRGMVRLIVGMCLNVGLDKLSLDQVRAAMQQRVILPRATSAPAEGLFLTSVKYPYLP
jgi:tRNA pseudouridine38-40 synthase